jgi:hypothetical protein
MSPVGQARTALVLAGGAARGAYEVVSSVCARPRSGCP